jgi:hypothetical protein
MGEGGREEEGGRRKRRGERKRIKRWVQIGGVSIQENMYVVKVLVKAGVKVVVEDEFGVGEEHLNSSIRGGGELCVFELGDVEAVLVIHSDRVTNSLVGGDLRLETCLGFEVLSEFSRGEADFLFSHEFSEFLWVVFFKPCNGIGCAVGTFGDRDELFFDSCIVLWKDFEVFGVLFGCDGVNHSDVVHGVGPSGGENG